MRNEFLIVTPVRNGWPLIRAAVASVRAARAEGVSLRHVVQLHSETDDECREWLEQQPDLELKVEDDRGLYDAIERGFRDGDEPLLGWLNCDEQYLPGALSQAAAVMDASPETDFVFGDYLLLDREGNPLALRKEIPARIWYLRHGVNYILSCATFFRRKIWEELEQFDPDFELVADKELYLRALRTGVSFQHVGYCWGAFGITGENRSQSTAALKEQRELRKKYGAYRWKPLRLLPRLCRILEKTLRGSYGQHRISTRLFDENGNRREVSGSIGSAWRWQ